MEGFEGKRRGKWCNVIISKHLKTKINKRKNLLKQVANRALSKDTIDSCIAFFWGWNSPSWSKVLKTGSKQLLTASESPLNQWYSLDGPSFPRKYKQYRLLRITLRQGKLQRRLEDMSSWVKEAETPRTSSKKQRPGGHSDWVTSPERDTLKHVQLSVDCDKCLRLHSLVSWTLCLDGLW